MKYVLDASVAVKWYVPEPDSPAAAAVRDAFQGDVHQLVAPDIFPVEVAHALAKLERRGLLPTGEAMQGTLDVLIAGPALRAHLPLLPRAVELATQARIGIYDCLYIALAEQEQCLLVAADHRLVNTFPAQTVALGPLSLDRP